MEEKLADAGSKMGQQGAQQQMSKEEAQKAMQQIEEAQGDGKSVAEQQSKQDGGESRAAAISRRMGSSRRVGIRVVGSSRRVGTKAAGSNRRVGIKVAGSKGAQESAGREQTGQQGVGRAQWFARRAGTGERAGGEWVDEHGTAGRAGREA